MYSRIFFNTGQPVYLEVTLHEYTSIDQVPVHEVRVRYSYSVRLRPLTLPGWCGSEECRSECVLLTERQTVEATHSAIGWG